MASYGAVPISTSIYKAAVRMNSITDGISTAIRTGNVVKKSAGSTRFQIHVKKSTKYPMRNIFASVPKPRFLPPKITTSTRSTVFISACQFPKLIPIFAEIALLIILHGSVPISTNSSNDNANPIPNTASSTTPSLSQKCSF